MKKVLSIIIIILFSVSCSQKDLTLRRLDDVNRASKKLQDNKDNEEVLLEVLNAAQNGGREV